MDALDLAMQAYAGQQAAPADNLDAAMQAYASSQPAASGAGGGRGSVNPSWASWKPPSVAERFMKGMNDFSAGGAQLLTHALPNGVVDAVNNATAKVNQMPVIGPLTQMLGMVPGTAQSLDQDIAQGEQQYQSARGRDPGWDIARGAGNLVASAPLMAVGGLGGSSVASGALTGGALGAMSPVTSGEFGDEKWKQIGTGTVLGGGTNAIIGGLGRLAAPEVQPAARRLIDEGMTLTPGQTFGGAVQSSEQKATSVPIVGDAIKGAYGRTNADLNRIAINRSLAPIGDELPKGTIGNAAIDYAQRKLGNAYESVINKIGSIKFDNTAVDNLANLDGLVGSMPPAQADQFGRILDSQILGRVDQYGRITGESLKAAESNLGDIGRSAIRSADYDTQQFGRAVMQAQAEIRDLIARQSPENAPVLKAINTGYANLMRPQRAAASVAAPDGVFNPAQLHNAVKALSSERQFSSGNALMQDLSGDAKNVLGSKEPDSGTAGRVLLGGGILGALTGHMPAVLMHPGTAIPAVSAAALGTAAYTKPGVAAMQGLLASRPDWAPLLRQGLLSGARVAPLLGGAATTASQAAQ